MHEALRPFKPTKSNPWDFDAAAHLWRRAGFGADPRRIERTLRRTPPEAVDAIVDGPPDDRAAAELETIYESVLGTDDADAARSWLIARMVRCDHQLREKMALFWHGHFATSIVKVRKLDWMMRQYRIFLDLGLTRFPALLEAVTRDPAMIRWLDNETNRKGHANENFAREVFELFTLGDGNYAEKDIQEAARAFTGWHILRDRFHFSRVLHDSGRKTVLGQTGKFWGEDVLRIAAEQPACGRFLARKLLTFFVAPTPDEELVESLGESLKEGGYDISATLKLLFRSELFFSKGTRGALVKSPLEYAVGAIRTFDARVDTRQAVAAVREMGQDLLAPPNVKGWPGQRDWINTASWLTRINAARGFAGSVDAGAALEHCGRALLGRPVSLPEKQAMVSGGAGGRDAVHALLSLPEAHLA
ncbi:MAG: DUF1800 domain-containing protein [Planctomycetota bacterium]|jgi:uncharacterized protein (DUF1800 family)